MDHCQRPLLRAVRGFVDAPDRLIAVQRCAVVRLGPAADAGYAPAEFVHSTGLNLPRPCPALEPQRAGLERGI
jgi:hypothetical protein